MNRERANLGLGLGLLRVWPWIVVGLFLAMATGIYFLGQRLEAVEDRVAYEMPPRYTQPDLADHVAPAAEAQAATVRQRVYVPVYSHVYRAGGHPYLLEATLSIRNVDPDHPVFVDSVVYYDSRGTPVRTYLEETIRLAPLETIEYVVEQKHTLGGAGANFIVAWRTGTGAVAPLVEAVMAGSSGQQAMAFVRQGVPIGGGD